MRPQPRSTLFPYTTLFRSVAGSIAFTNSGVVAVAAGTLSIGGGGTDSGVYSVAAGATLAFAGGVRNLEAGSDLSGAGPNVGSGGTSYADASMENETGGASW